MRRHWRKALPLVALAVLTATAGCTLLAEWIADRDETTAGPPCRLDVRGEGNLRVFALGYKFDLAETRDYAAWRNRWLNRVRNDVLPCLRADGANVLVFPEDVGLIAAFLGERGADGRTSNDSTTAFVQLALSYNGQMREYRRRFGDLSDARALMLALTNVVWQSTLDTFGEIARLASSPVVVSINAPPRWRETTDPDDLTIFGDAQLFPNSTIVAVTSSVQNLAVVFSAEGELAGTVPKNYLVPAEEDTLDMDWGDLRSFAPIEVTAGGLTVPLGSVISKDAWMPDVLRRLDDLGARILIQPEAFSGWGIVESQNTEWLPDVFMESSHWSTQQHAPFVGSVVPMLTGNLFELVFDGQSHITRKALPSDARLAFVGNAPQAGFAAVGEWALDDPGLANPLLSEAERRAVLREYAQELSAGSGSANENAYVESVAVADVQVGPGIAWPFAAPGAGSFHARRPAAALLSGVSPLVVWTALSATTSTLRWGEFEQGTLVERGGIGAPDIPANSVRVAPLANGGAIAVWTQGAIGQERVRWASFDATTRNWSSPSAVTHTGGPQWWPALATAGDRFAVAWLDLSDRWGAIRVATGTVADGLTTPVRVDGKEPGALKGPRNGAFAPAVAMNEHLLLVAWTDFRDFSWDVYAAVSTDAGATFTEPRRVDHAGSNAERIHRGVVAALDADGVMWLAWTDMRDRRADSDVVVAFSTDGETWQEVNVSPPGPSSEAEPSLAIAGGRTWVAFQSTFEDATQIFVTSGLQTGAFRPAEAADPERSPMSHAWAPALASGAAETPLLVWEDGRSGWSTVRAQLNLAP